MLRAEYFGRHPDGNYPLFFEDQVALFEAHGSPWPWRTRLSPSQRDRLEKRDPRSDAPFHGPTRVGALVRERPSGVVDVVLPLLNREDGVRLLNAGTPVRSGNERYHLTLVCPEQASAALRALAEERPDLSDPFLKTRHSAREWKTMLRTLRSEDAPYRTLIEKALARRKTDDGEAFDIMPRVLPPKRCEVALLGVETMRIAAA